MDSNGGYLEFCIPLPKCARCLHWVVNTATGVGRCNECISANRHKGCGLFVADTDVRIEDKEKNNGRNTDDNGA